MAFLTDQREDATKQVLSRILKNANAQKNRFDCHYCILNLIPLCGKNNKKIVVKIIIA